MLYSNEDFILDLLKENGTVTAEALQMAGQHRKNTESTLETLLRINQVQEAAITQALAVASGMDPIDLNQYPIDENVVKAAQAGDCVRYRMIPLSYDGSSLTVAVSDPMNMETLDSLQHVLPYPPNFVCASPSQIEKCIADFFAGDPAVQGIGGTAITVKGGEATGQASGEDAPIINMVNQMLADAVQQRASDIHLEPLENEVRIRYRIDGALHEMAKHPTKLLNSIVSRLKIM
ncbi:MAG: ATPase, T2SS/T4P/T4SS family, partial [Verrucomicrobiota bacterium]